MILVTGANGKAANEVVRGLSANGTPVRALVRSLANAKSIEGPGVEIVQGDLAQIETLPRILEGVDAVFLATGLAPDMAELHRNLIEAATRSDVRHIVRLSVLPAAIDAPIRGPRLHGSGSGSGTIGRAERLEQAPIGFEFVLDIKPSISRAVTTAGVKVNPGGDAVAKISGTVAKPKIR